MITKKLGLVLLTVFLIGAAAADSYAEISNAAVLFLRIAPGARAAGMGEAFVAVADDATTTHWNPAGLGARPLADGWTVSQVPAHIRPLRAIAAVKHGGGSDFDSYEIWGISESKGLVRYDGRRWHEGELFSTRTDQTIRGIVSGYFKVQDEAMLDQMVARVARANAAMSYEDLGQLRDSILAVVPETYRDRPFLSERLDSLMVAYTDARVRWENVAEARKGLADGLKDGTLETGEIDKIGVAIERARMRFIPEEVMIPYTVVFDGQPTAISSRDKLLVVGTSDGLFTYDGRSWRTFTEAEGLPSNDIRSLYAGGALFYVGTAKGMVMFGGRDITSVDTTGSLPAGAVAAIGADGGSKLYAVVDGKLYFYNKTRWTDSRPYTIAVGDTPEAIAERFAIYGTAAEKQAFVEEIKRLNPSGPIAPVQVAAAPPAEEKPADTTAQVTDSTTVAADSAAAVEPAATETPAETATMPPRPSGDVDWSNLPPGDVLYLPFAVEIKGYVNSVVVRQDELFVGTEYGLLYFDGYKWKMPGWKVREAGAGETVASLVDKRFRSSDTKGRQQYQNALMAVNGLQETETLDSGRTVLVYENAVAAPINQVTVDGGRVFFATSEGLRVLEEGRLSRVNERGMGEANTIFVRAIEGELWLASDEEIVVKANGRTEISLMHVNWLPELASDMYYDFASAVFQIGDIGTGGINVTYLTYGEITRTGQTSSDPISTFESFDLAVTGAFGFSLTQKLKTGIGAKLIYSRLSDLGAGDEQGEGTSTGFAFDLGLLYQWSPRLNLGLAITNLGWDMAYIDPAQSDPLPRNLAVGFAYKLFQTNYSTLLVTAEMNKILVDVDFGDVGGELQEAIFNGGVELTYADLIAGRFGYVYDQEGKVKTFTLGAGLHPLDWMRADFSYIPNSKDVALANTLRFSLSIMP